MGDCHPNDDHERNGEGKSSLGKSVNCPVDCPLCPTVYSKVEDSSSLEAARRFRKPVTQSLCMASWSSHVLCTVRTVVPCTILTVPSKFREFVVRCTVAFIFEKSQSRDLPGIQYRVQYPCPMPMRTVFFWLAPPPVRYDVRRIVTPAGLYRIPALTRARRIPSPQRFLPFELALSLSLSSLFVLIDQSRIER
jgi:hypothetical protein